MAVSINGGVLFVGACIIRALLFGVYVGAPDFENSHLTPACNRLGDCIPFLYTGGAKRDRSLDYPWHRLPTA